MNEKSVRLTAQEVRGVLSDRKTQWRHPVKLPHRNPLGQWEPILIGGPNGGRTAAGATLPLQGGIWHTRTGDALMCPYGGPGDRLWVRETWSADFANHYPFEKYWYAADDDRLHEIHVCDGVRGIHSTEHDSQVPFRRRPSVHMPRSASRILLEITEVHAERLQEICATDAVAEGLSKISKDGKMVKYGIADADGLPGTDNWGWPWHEWRQSPIDAYERLWNERSIARGVGWNDNPWVWAITFKRVIL